MKDLFAALLVASLGATARAYAAPLSSGDGALNATSLNALFDNNRSFGQEKVRGLLVLGEASGRSAPPVTAKLVLASYGLSTPCDSLRDKAQRLRRAAAECDAAVARGELSSCRVQLVTFNLPGTPELMSPGAARSLAADLESRAGQGDELGCHDAGGEGVVPQPQPPTFSQPQESPAVADPPAPSDRAPSEADERKSAAEQDAEEARLFKDLRDALNTSANPQIKDALIEWAAGGMLKKITYGPDAAWTKALQNHGHLDGVRRRIRAAFQRGPVDDGPHPDPFILNKLSTGHNLLIFLRDALAPFMGLNMAYTTGSMNFYWKKGAVDEANRQVTIEFTATDKLRLGSLTRLLKTQKEGLPDDVLGKLGPGHTVELEWHWTEVISY